jgi:hypothetical protein
VNSFVFDLKDIGVKDVAALEPSSETDCGILSQRQILKTIMLLIMAHKPGKSIFMENWVGTVELGVFIVSSILGGTHEYFYAPDDFPLLVSPPTAKLQMIRFTPIPRF